MHVVSSVVQAMYDARCGESGLLRRAEAGQMLVELNLRGGEGLLGGAGSSLMDWPTFFMHYVAAAAVAAPADGAGAGAAARGSAASEAAGGSVWVPTVVGTWREVGAQACKVLLQVRAWTRRVY